MRAKEQRVLFWLKSLGDEVDYIGTSPLQEKFKVILLMVYIDIFSKVWGCLLTKNTSLKKSQAERFAQWSDKFVFDESNRTYLAHKEEFQGLTGHLLYRVRNSLVHFGALPNNGQAIFISKWTRKEFFEKYSSRIRGQPIVVLCPRTLFPAVAYAVVSTIESMAELQRLNPGEYRKMMLDLYDRIQEESAMPIWPK